MQIWDDFVLEQEKTFGKKNVDEWLRTLKVVTFDARNLYLEASTTFQKNWFDEHIRPRLKDLKSPSSKPFIVHLNMLDKKAKSAKKSNFYEKVIEPDSLISSSTLDLFHVTEKNELAYKLISNIQLGDDTFNPIFISGPPGIGKTHLLMGCAHRFIQQKKRVFYVRAGTFTSHVISAIQFGNMQNFRKAYRGIDILLFDDAHVLARKKATQEEFFHTFNTLHTMGVQIIIAANTPPKDLEYIEPRLISRFEWGISLTLDKYSRADLEHILKEKTERLKFEISQESLTFLLDTFLEKSVFLALDALLLRLKSASNLTEVKASLSDLIEKEGKRQVTADYIIKMVASHYQVQTEDILGKSQTREMAYPRKVAMFLLRIHLKLPYLRIAEKFKRDHSTVMTAVKAIQKKPTDEVEKLLERL